MKIIGFAGSTSSRSINKRLVQFTLDQIKGEDFSTELIDLKDYPLPIFNVDVEEEKGYPQNAYKFMDKIKEADALVVSMAEHNGSYAAEVKNLLDWCSRIELGFFHDLPMFLMSTSPGGFGGGNVLEAAKSRFPKFNADLRSTFKLPKFKDHFSDEEGIIDSELRKEHHEQLDQFLSSLA